MDITPELLKSIIKESITECQIKLTMTLDECSQVSGIGKNKLMELAHSQKSDFPSFKIGSKFLINREMLSIWLERVTKEGRVL